MKNGDNCTSVISRSVMVDASAVLAVVLNEPEKVAIVRATRGCEAKAPGCLSWEIGNAFSAMVRRGRLTIDGCLRALEIYRSIPIQETSVDLGAALEIASRHDIFAYDAYYLMAAKAHRIELLSLDRRMLEAARSEGVAVKSLEI